MSASPAITADEIISLALHPHSTLPSPLPLPSLLALLTSPSPALLSSLLTLLLRSSSSATISLLTPLFPPLFPRLSSSSLLSLLETLVSDLSFFSDANICTLLDLLPPLITLIISSYGIGTVLPFMDRILASEWPKAFVLKFSSILREFPLCLLHSCHVVPFVERIFEGMNGIDVQDLPSLIYQLLLLASKRVHRRDVIKGILGFFGGRIKGPVSIVKQIEGTVLMHVNFAVKQDSSLGQEIITIVKSDFGALNHFMVNVLLSIARVKRFNENVMTVLKSAVLDSNRDWKVSRNCKWLPKCVQEQYFETAKSIEKSILKSVNESNGGREQVVPSIVQLGLLLLESPVGDLNGDDELAVQMLKSLFEMHEMARTEIIEQCKYRILAMKPQQSNGSIRLLGCLIQNYKYTMLGFVSHLKELLDYFAYMHEKTASSLITCILPLVKSSRELQDYIILVIRKAMFKRDESVRVAATKAVADLICGSGKKDPNPVTDSSSQVASCSQRVDFDFGNRSLFDDLSGLLRRCLSQQDPNPLLNSSSQIASYSQRVDFDFRNRSLFDDLSGLLRRCLQQARVKEVLYEGLVRIVESDPSIANTILDFLWPHFSLFYSEESECAIKTDACFKLENGKMRVTEPLDHMIYCINRIIILNQIKSDRPSEPSWPCFGFSTSQDIEIGKSCSVESFTKALSKIRKYLAKCSTEDKQIQSQETGTSTGTSSASTETNQMKRILYLGLIEVFINATLSEIDNNSKIQEKENNNSSSEKELTGLIDSYHHFDKKMSLSKKLKTHFFTTSRLQILLEASLKSFNNSNDLSSDNNTQNRTQISQKKDRNPKLISFCLNACFKHIQSSENSNGDLKRLVKPIMQLVLCLVPVVKQETCTARKNTKNKSDQLLIALLCLKELSKILSLCKFGDFLKEIISVVSPETEFEFEILRDDYDDRISDLLWVFYEKEIKPIFNQLVSSSLYAESEALADFILTIGKKLSSEKRNSIGTYLIQLLKTHKIPNPNLSQTLISLATTLIPDPNDLTLSKEIASELLAVIGSCSDDPNPESSELPAVNSSTKDALAGVLIEGAESSISEFDWVLLKIKEMINGFSYGPGKNKKISRVDLEDSLYSRLVQVVHLLSIFAEMNLNDCQAEHFLKLNAKLYKLLARLAKFQIAPKGFKQSFPGSKFQKLAEETCKHLTCQLYNFVSFVQWKDDNNGPANKGALNKIKRESRCIPDLIFQIEDYEKYLIKLTKLTKVNLMRYAKRSASRDFKIIIPKDTDQDVKEPENNENENGVGSGSESEKCEGLDEKCTGENGYSDSEREEERKRVKCSDVVQDSDEEG